MERRPEPRFDWFIPIDQTGIHLDRTLRPDGGGPRSDQRRAAGHQRGALWNGISKVRVNLGTAIVGDPGQVVDELAAYWRLGIDEFILSGFPHVEECRRVASDVLPGLRAAIKESDWHDHRRRVLPALLRQRAAANRA